MTHDDDRNAISAGRLDGEWNDTIQSQTGLERVASRSGLSDIEFMSGRP